MRAVLVAVGFAALAIVLAPTAAPAAERKTCKGSIDGRIVGFSCGRGGSGELRKRPHAFTGTVRG